MQHKLPSASSVLSFSSSCPMPPQSANTVVSQIAKAQMTVGQLMDLDKDMRAQNMRILNSITDVKSS